MSVNEVLKALSDPTRRRILKILGEGEKNAGCLAESFDLTGATMSHHFAVLKKSGLIRSRKEGTQVIYTLNATVLQEVMMLALELMGAQREQDKAAEPVKQTVKKTAKEKGI
jgi:ArsR family transcriptional regulator, arsenate/arsenite/antimonite-responsive transcriptional repressor